MNKSWKIRKKNQKIDKNNKTVCERTKRHSFLFQQSSNAKKKKTYIFIYIYIVSRDSRQNFDQKSPWVDVMVGPSNFKRLLLIQSESEMTRFASSRPNLFSKGNGTSNVPNHHALMLTREGIIRLSHRGWRVKKIWGIEKRIRLFIDQFDLDLEIGILRDVRETLELLT